MARIVIDGRMINESGIGRYLRNLLENLQTIDMSNEYFVLLLQKDFEELTFKKNFKKVEANFLWYTLIEQIELPKILNKIDPDLVHFPHFNVPIFYRGKFVVTIHDLIHQHQEISTHGKLVFGLKRYGYRKVFGAALKKSEKILVPSEFVKQQLISEWKVKDNKILMTPEGVDEKLLKTTGKLLGNVKPPYILYVGNAHLHKNVEGLIKTFLILRKNYQYLQLVLTGKENHFWEEIRKKYDNPNIIYTGFVSDEELAALYKNAKVYVEPSFEEGFGLPVLEAFANNCPVVASDIGSLKEVGGDGAVYFNPKNTEDMVDKISMVLNSEKLQKDLIEKGKKRIKLFSWKKMAEQTLEVYEQDLF
jgi:glycosyltransferase involved in cell wall biosynthesis